MGRGNTATVQQRSRRSAAGAKVHRERGTAAGWARARRAASARLWGPFWPCSLKRIITASDSGCQAAFRLAPQHRPRAASPVRASPEPRHSGNAALIGGFRAQGCHGKPGGLLKVESTSAAAGQGRPSSFRNSIAFHGITSRSSSFRSSITFRSITPRSSKHSSGRVGSRGSWRYRGACWR